MSIDPIQSLWVGPRLSMMERLSIQSFLKHGHPYHLFTYDAIENVPRGVIVEDARAILPESWIFQYQKYPSYAGFSNYFRYKLLLERGGWWSDTDVICLRAFDFEPEHVFASERTRDGSEVATSAVLKAPSGSPAIRYAWDVCQSRHPESLAWGETGPRLVADLINRFGLDRDREPARTFCPISYFDWNRLIELDPDSDWGWLDQSHAVHLWNEMWRRGGVDKDAAQPPGCLFEYLKRLDREVPDPIEVHGPGGTIRDQESIFGEAF